MQPSLSRGCGRKRPKWIAVAHLSENNNAPELAIDAQRRAAGRNYPVFLAARDRVSELLTL